MAPTQFTVQVHVSYPELHLAGLGHGWSVSARTCPYCHYRYVRLAPLQSIHFPCPRCGLGGGDVVLGPEGAEPPSDGPWLTGVQVIGGKVIPPGGLEMGNA